MPPDRPPRDPRPDPADTGAPVRFGAYLLERRIAIGGTSEVYLARPLEGLAPAPRVVIKRLLPSLVLDPQASETFAREARLHQRIRHTSVVEVYETGVVDGEPFLVMEYVAGVDAARLLRRAQAERRRIPPALCVYVACELCRALAAVHRASDDAGRPLGIVHRDVTPSNVYLSHDGDVKLGDFGIARETTRATRPTAAQVLKGKYQYMAPEQVGGDPSDHRADLFSLVVVLSEMLIGQPIFPGAGQLAVLLSIRDVRIDPLRAAAGSLPPKLFRVVERGLLREPADRFQTADDLREALEPFQHAARDVSRKELSEWVGWAHDARALAGRIEGEIRRSSARMPAAAPAPPDPMGEPDDLSDRTTPIQPLEATVRTRAGRLMSHVPFSKLVELMVTGQLGRDDEVDMLGRGFRRLDQIPELERHLPVSTTETTARLAGPGAPDYLADLPDPPMLGVLAWLLKRRETGVVFAERPGEAGGGAGTRKEFYLHNGRVVHVASNEPSELFGEYLVARGKLDRGELDLALAVLPRYGGRLGDTLIALGLVDAMDVFRAIREQGRDRIAEIFRWSSGRVSFYRGVVPQRVQFRLDIDIPFLMMAGLQLHAPDAALVARWRGRDAERLGPVRPPPEHARSVAWPQTLLNVLGALGTGMRVGELVLAAQARGIARGDVLRALEVSIAAEIVAEA